MGSIPSKLHRCIKFEHEIRTYKYSVDEDSFKYCHTIKLEKPIVKFISCNEIPLLEIQDKKK